MNLTIIGTGFVGVVSSGVFASFGNIVYGLDIDQKKVDMLTRAEIPFYEPGLEQLVKEGVAKKTLTFTTDYTKAIPSSDVIMIAVGTPSAMDGQADLTYVFAAAKSLAPHLKDGAIVAVKSTVPPGTCDKVAQVIRDNGGTKPFHVVSLPEFLKEGSAVEDTLHPDRIIIGATDAMVIEKLKELHKPLGAPVVVMKPESAQMCKYTSNAYLATRITFINQIANLCEANGANIQEVIAGIGLDKRIGKHYWYPGLGYGGSCFPKDVKELAAYAKAIGQENNLMVTVSTLNEERMVSLLSTFEQQVGGWKGKTVAVLGLSFKPNTNDMREAPSTKAVPALLAAGAVVHSYDPMTNEEAARYFGSQKLSNFSNYHMATSVDEALKGAHVALVLVEWPQLITLEPSHIKELMVPNAIFIDCRDQYDRAEIEKVGLKYIGIGL
ncbi:UDP-glucose 6-dehydrogenase [Candidatus Cerribacteria bacterium 'Amazon FNV 2010 28 9']|uniref:UDP-glucose 6-dehydrogenase n=1 Tax=Candidatus Cerribacteria bacterium 'Amazon FNV 2010 28 9' TaxID=2081795 RepID=A0A317JQD4_9BACT|nr:MAG: UDP-glucose 6-dehydrogenase [Candidatus Cerribacteria bacterium 'Amazon FNV 2010 28 9']